VEPGSAKSRTSIHRLRSLLGSGQGALSTTRGIVRRNLWIAPVVAMIALVIAALWVRSHIESAIKEQTASELTTLLKADVEALTMWMRLQRDNATIIASDEEIRQLIGALVAYAAEGNSSPTDLLQAPQRQELAAELRPWIDRQAYGGFIVFGAEGLILAADEDVLVGQRTLATEQREFIQRVLAGQASVSQPYPSRILLEDSDGQMRVGVPVMFVAAPVRGADDKPIAVVALRIDPGREFTDILSVGQPGETGETYAFDQRGVFLSQSRFDDQLKRLALLPDQPHVRSVLTLEMRDPGVDMTTGRRPEKLRSEQPLTANAIDAIRRKPSIKQPGVNVDGYRDYRGVYNVGAWAWLPEYQFGIVTEMDQDEAFRPMFVLRRVFWVLFGLLGLVALLLVALTLFAGRLERRMREAVIAAGQLGQYALEEKIGEGGMGSVYRARHAMLRRPTAVKLLEPGKTTETSVARFEREVQLTSQLNHPNTITIYDYGRTAEGVFYYAMEYLEGFSLDLLVQRFGPQPDGRVIPILSQVCASLIEAHSAKLIHRDIKPANIMLTRRGGVCDFVKLLDFGLVKALDSHKMRTLTAADAITGTPLYMAPETIQDAEGCDARGDLYALGAVGYYLLTGRPVFETGGVLEIMRAHVETRPIAPSQRLARPMSRELEHLLLKCLEKSPADRPQSAAEMALALAGCVPEQPWSAADAENWWRGQGQTVTMDPRSTVTQDLQPGATIGFSEVRRTV